MNVRVKFFGAAGAVTGSKYLLEIDDYKLLVDCGLFQGVKELRLLNWEPFPIDPKEIDAVVLTHAHIDHSGYLPRLVREGFKGKIYCTSPTLDLVKLLLKDSAKLQEEEAAFARKKKYSKHENPQPLYDTKDVEKLLPMLHPAEFEKTLTIDPRIQLNYRMAGHILGAGIVELELSGSYQSKKIVFSGDLGRSKDPVLYPPAEMAKADILFIESTYGDRENPMVDTLDKFEEIIHRSIERKGVLLIPAFAVGRTQLLTYYMKVLLEKNSIPDIPVYIDSPMAINATDLYREHHDFHKFTSYNNNSYSPIFDYPGIRYIQDQEESVKLNLIKKDAIIISASGMCTGGRIMHHLYRRLQNENDTIMFVGYQAESTRGRRILDGEPTVKMFGYEVPVKCQVEQIDGLSAHADRSELIHWLNNFNDKPKRTYVVHGEQKSSEALASYIQHDLGWNVTVPELKQSEELFNNI